MNKKFVAILVLEVVLGAGVALLPQVASQGLAIQVAMAAAAMMVVSGLAAIWYFTSSLSAFKTSTKASYYIIAVGLLMFAILQLVQLYAVLFPKVPLNVFLAAALTLVPYLSSSLIMYLGVRKLAKLLGIHYLWKSFWLVLGCAVVIAVGSYFLPHTPKPDAQLEAASNLIIALVAWSIAFSAAGSLVARRIQQTISTGYQEAMGWLSFALGALAVATLHEIIVKDTAILNTIYVQTNASIWPFVLTVISFMKAGQSFKAASDRLNTQPVHATYLDAVTYAASLVSNPSDVDTTLDKVRQITANLKPGQTVTTAQKSTLVEVYKELETYLVTKEPLRQLTRADLRARLSEDFQQALGPAKA